MIVCNQSGCSELAAYRYTWPGRDEAAICEQHVTALRSIAAAMGLYVQTIPIATDREGK